MPEIDREDILLAWLHDPFDKALAIQEHETRAARYASATLGREVSRMGLHRLTAGADMVAVITERLPSPTAGARGERAVCQPARHWFQLAHSGDRGPVLETKWQA